MIHRNWRTIFILLTLFVDSGAVALAASAAFAVRSAIPNITYLPSTILYYYTAYFAAATLFAALLVGVYRSAFHINLARQYYLASKAYFYSLVIVFASLYILQPANMARRFTILFYAILPFTFMAGRWLLNKFNSAMRRHGIGMHKVLLVGYDSQAHEIIERFRKLPELGYSVTGVLTHSRHARQLMSKEAGVAAYSLDQLEDVLVRDKIDRMFIPSTAELANGYGAIVPICRRHMVKLKVLSPEADRLLRMAHVYDIAGITVVAPIHHRLAWAKRVAKRIFDVVGSVLVMFVLSPIFIVTSSAILLESGFPVFFRQKRTAIKGGPSFDFFKFRSMVHNADELKEGLILKNESNGGLFKMKNDPRMTKVGRIIRKFSIDELPQLYNVLRGDMSLVGPRPLPIGDFKKLSLPSEYWDSIKDRTRVKPGMTGLWQVSGRSHLGFEEMIWLDLYYAENQSLLFDLEILFATIPVVLFGKGAY